MSPERTERLIFRVSLQELDLIEQKAKTAGMTRSEYLRACAINTKIKPKPIPQPMPELNIQIFTQLGRIGGLLNQAMKAVNSGIVQNIPSSYLEELRELLIEIRTQLCRQGWLVKSPKVRASGA